jgi:hypothetical protein
LKLSFLAVPLGSGDSAGSGGPDLTCISFFGVICC